MTTPSPISDQAAGEPGAFEREAAKGVHSAFNACMYRDSCRKAITAPTTGSAPKHILDPSIRFATIADYEALGTASPAASVLDSALAEIYTAACEWTDDWAERQETTPTKQVNDAIFIRRVMALLAASMGGDRT